MQIDDDTLHILSHKTQHNHDLFCKEKLYDLQDASDQKIKHFKKLTVFHLKSMGHRRNYGNLPCFVHCTNRAIPPLKESSHYIPLSPPLHYQWNFPRIKTTAMSPSSFLSWYSLDLLSWILLMQL